jgi:opacity protein-like surface antigen
MSILPSLSLKPSGRFLVGLASLLLVASAAPVEAQSFISPYIGYNFGGDSGCPTITNCEDKKLNAGVAFGSLGTVMGAELDLGYAKDFFGSAPELDSSVLTVMGNLMVAPKFGPVQPYLLAGVGLMKTHVSLTLASVLTSDNNNVGWDVGGGVIVFFGSHLGVRGDLRYFHSFQELDFLGFTLSDAKLNFGRASGGLVLKF